MHYVDEGSGEPIVFVHGNPAWSFEFRKLIKEFSPGEPVYCPQIALGSVYPINRLNGRISRQNKRKILIFFLNHST